MKYYILKEIVLYLVSNFKLIKAIRRVDVNTILVEFDKDNVIYFDLSKGNSSIYKKEQNTNAKREFNAPFDIVLNKRFTNSQIENIRLLNDDKIILFEVISQSSYKKLKTLLHLEFTGKWTNIIITDELGIILEALRHIDEFSSSRVVKVGQTLNDVPKVFFEYKIEPVENIEKVLFETYKVKEQNELENLKKQKTGIIKKQILKYEKLLNSLQSEEFLQKESDGFYEKANLILANIHKIKPYQTSVVLEDFSGKSCQIELDLNYPTATSFANSLFSKAKKSKQKAKYNYMQRANLEEKIAFYKRVINQINLCKSIEEIEFLLPKKEKNQTKTKKQNPYESYFYKGYKIMLGRNERENIYLLENSKANDFWFHLQEQTSCHIIVQNSKKELPQDVIVKAAKLVASFSSDFGGTYTVDFTQRRNVKIQNGANVLYNPYSSVVVKI